MCGIVFMGTRVPGIRDIEFFENLLYMDTIRGPHSTGVAAMFKHGYGKDLTVSSTIRKAAITGPEFLATSLWEDVSERRTPGFTKNSFTIERPFLLLGHNRWATRGAVNARNAHPFRCGHIILVHNGTLTNQALLPDHENYEVDSENIAHAISTIGAAETIQKLNGAFTLAWINEQDKTFNIIRNKERPFHLAETSSGDWFGASEENMLMWILNRGKIPPTIKRHFECEVGVQYVFDISLGTCVFKEEIKHELPTFRVTSTTTTRSGNGWWNDYGRGESYNGTYYKTDAEKRAEEKAKCEAHGLNAGRDTIVTFKAVDYKPYHNHYPATNPTYGKLEGYLEPFDGYVEVEALGIVQGTYESNKDGLFQGKILSVEMNGEYLKLKVGLVAKATKEINLQMPKKQLPSVVVVPRDKTVEKEGNEILKELGLFVEIGDTITYKGEAFVNENVVTTCGIIRGSLDPCSKHIAVSGISCFESDFKEGQLYEGTVSKVKYVGETKRAIIFVRDVQKTSVPVQHEVNYVDDDYGMAVLMSALVGDIDSYDPAAMDMADDTEYLEEIGKLKTGERFTRKQWMEPRNCECGACGSPVAFEDIGECSMVSGYMFCPSCAEWDDDIPFEPAKKTVTKQVEIDGLPYIKTETIDPKSNVTSMFFSCKECNRRLPISRQVGAEEVCDDCAGKKHRSRLTLRKPLYLGTTKTTTSQTTSPLGSQSKASSAGTTEPTHKLLRNGFTVNVDLWSKMNKCKHCDIRIGWGLADAVSFVGGVPVCPSCASKLA